MYRVLSLIGIGLLSIPLISGLENPHSIAAQLAPKRQRQRPLTSEAVRVEKTASYLTNKTAPFAVDGSALPDVDFNIGESYAGTLSIDSNPNNHNRLWFWFFPSTNPNASDEITIWLNGGPGCSSLDGLFQENGPFLWQPGTYRPVVNQYSFTNLTNMIWIDQPVSTGFSPGNVTINDEHDVAKYFLGFWKNFMSTFDLKGRKVYITGESYAGQYIPYIASAMLDTKNTEFYNLKGIQIIDPLINDFTVTTEAQVVAAANQYNNVLNINSSYLEFLNKKADSCGYTSFLEKSLVFPPTGPLPTAPFSTRCDVFTDFTLAAIYVNPCYNVYHITDSCPFLWDELGSTLAGGPNDYFNRSDVQKVIHAPPTDYTVCSSGPGLFPNGDLSPPSGLSVLPGVIERTKNVIIGHGLLDFLLFANGTLVTIQNMTWNGKQGFQEPPSDLFYVPYHPGLAEVVNGVASRPFTNDAGAGIAGTFRTERGLTFVTVNLSGHMIPENTPGAAYRQLELLLGRIKSLAQRGDFTTQPGVFSRDRPKPERRRLRV